MERAVLVRLANAEDVAAVMKVVGRSVPLMRAAGNLQWDEEYPSAGVFQRDVRLQQLWVAEVAGQIAGMVAITTDQSPEFAGVGWNLDEPAIVVHRLGVDPEFRGLGIARRLMQEAETVAQARGISVLRVDTSAENQVMPELMRKLGYGYSGEIGLGYRPGLRVRCFEKRL